MVEVKGARGAEHAADLGLTVAFWVALNTRLRICFVAPSAYPVMVRSRDIPFVGGAEVQQAFLSQELARRGHEVSMITMDHGQREGDRVDGVRLLKMHAPEAGAPVFRFVHPRLTSLWRAMHRANADVYYQRAAGATTGFVVGYARAHGRGSVYAVASDLEFDPGVPQVRFARDRFLFRYGVKNAGKVVVQSEWQKRACREAFGRESELVRSCYGHVGLPGCQSGPIVWVGSVKPVKRPALFLDVAQRMPQYKFKLIGGPGSGAVDFNALRARAESLGNVEMPGFVPYADIESHFDGASLLVNTSVGEGFPNTFLQAWARGIPTVSFFDTGARSHETSVGVVAADLDSMVRELIRLGSDSSVWQERSKRVSAYFAQHHNVSRTVDDYERIFNAFRPFYSERCT